MTLDVTRKEYLEKGLEVLRKILLFKEKLRNKRFDSFVHSRDLIQQVIDGLGLGFDKITISDIPLRMLTHSSQSKSTIVKNIQPPTIEQAIQLDTQELYNRFNLRPNIESITAVITDFMKFVSNVVGLAMDINFVQDTDTFMPVLLSETFIDKDGNQLKITADTVTYTICNRQIVSVRYVLSRVESSGSESTIAGIYELDWLKFFVQGVVRKVKEFIKSVTGKPITDMTVIQSTVLTMFQTITEFGRYYVIALDEFYVNGVHVPAGKHIVDKDFKILYSDVVWCPDSEGSDTFNPCSCDLQNVEADDTDLFSCKWIKAIAESILAKLTIYGEESSKAYFEGA